MEEELELLYQVRCNELKENKKYYENRYDIYRKYREYDYFKDIIPNETAFKDILRKVNNRKSRRYRTNKKMLSMIEYASKYDMQLVFATLTFSDKELKNEERTRTKKIDKYIKESTILGLANIDYGKTTEREHHHFVGIVRSENELIPILNKKGKQRRTEKGVPLWKLKNDTYSLGEVWSYEKIDIKDTKRLVNYLLKIENHSSKNTTKNRRIRFLYDKEYFGII